MRDRFVRPELTRIPLSDGDWLLVKRRLSAGEEREAHARMFEEAPDGTLRPNRLRFDFAIISAYVVDWSLLREGEPLAIRGMAPDDLELLLHDLAPEELREFRIAIEEHEARQEAARLAEKKSPVGERASPPISLSPVDAVGVSRT
jgi:hypothetical protein